MYNCVHTCYKSRLLYYSNVIVTTYFRNYKVLIFTDFSILPPYIYVLNKSIPQNSKIFLFTIVLFQDAVLCGNNGRVLMKRECVPEQVTHGLI